jgi:putative endonuclease
VTSPTQNRGRYWEKEVASFLEQRGLAVIARGYRCRLGELDLVCNDAATLVVVEVRARAGRSHGGALESVDARKRRKIVQATRYYLMQNPSRSADPVRFDVVAIDTRTADDPVFTWIRNAFDGC